MKNLIQNFLRAWKHPRWRWAFIIAVLASADTKEQPAARGKREPEAETVPK